MNLGGLYDDNLKNTDTAGLETGIRYFLLNKTFINFGIEYSSFFDDGAYFYTLGVGFNF